MKADDNADELLAAYALGRLSEQELERVEQRMFADREFLGRLRVVEDELIDAYASGRLTSDERRRFEKYLLQPGEDRDRVEFSRALSALVSGRRKRARTGHHWFAAITEFVHTHPIVIPLAASVALAVACAWLLVLTSRLTNSLEQVRAEKAGAEQQTRQLDEQLADERLRGERLSEALELERERREMASQTQLPASYSGLASFVLMPGGVRGGSATTAFAVPTTATRVRLEPVFKSRAHPRYRAELQTVDGRVLWSRTGLPARARGAHKSVPVIVPARYLKEDDYVLAVIGISSDGAEESVGEYYFRVLGK